MAGEALHRQFDGGDQLAFGEHVVQLRLVAGQAVKVHQVDAPLAMRPFDVHPRVQRRQRDAHVRGMHGDARLAGTEDGVDAVAPVACAAAGPRLALVARGGGVIEVVAAGALQQITAGAGHVAQLGRCPGKNGLAQQRVALLDLRVPGQVGVAHQRTDAQATLGGLFDLTQRQAVDVDQLARMQHVFLHQVEQVGATGDIAAVRPVQGDGLVDTFGALVAERRHCAPSWPRSTGSASSMAARMFG